MVEVHSIDIISILVYRHQERESLSVRTVCFVDVVKMGGLVAKSRKAKVNRLFSKPTFRPDMANIYC